MFFEASLAVAVPVKVLGFGSSLLTHYTSAQRTGHELVCKTLHGFDFFVTEFSLMPQILKSFLEDFVACILNFHSLDVDP